MSEKVLLVDDEKDFLEVMSERLTSRGMVVRTSDSAEGALNLIKQESFDVVVLDLKMPGMDGMQALKQIKDKWPDIQVLLLTGHATVEKGVEAIKMGAMDFIEKPADLSNLGDRIREAKHQRMLIVDKMNEDRMADILRRFGF